MRLADDRCSSSQAMIAPIASAGACPSNRPESISTASSAWATKRRPAQVRLAVAGRDHRRMCSPNLLRELEVALVVGGHAHDRAGAVLHQHEVGDPDRHPLAVERIDDVPSGEDALLLASRRHRARRRTGPPMRASSRRPPPRARCRAPARPSGCSGAITMKVTPNIVSGRVVKTGSSTVSSPPQRKIDPRALRAADPVPLHRHHLLGPLDASARPSSSWSAYAVILKNHCSSFALDHRCRSARSGRRSPARWPARSDRPGTS